MKPRVTSHRSLDQVHESRKKKGEKLQQLILTHSDTQKKERVMIKGRRTRCCHCLLDKPDNNSTFSSWAHSTVSCQHLLTVQSDFHHGKHRYRALERGRERECATEIERERARERERAIERRGRETGGSEWAPVVTERPCFSRCWWTHLHREEGGSNKQSMRKECGRGRDRGMEGRLNSVLFSALTPCQPFPELVSTLGMWLKRGM